MLRRRQAPPRWRLIGHSIRGASHERSGAPNQDALSLSPEQGEGLSVVCAIGDGHGGKRYFRSDVGSRFAVEVAQQAIGSILRSLPPDGLRSPTTQAQIGANLPITILEAWRTEVDAHRNIHPLTPEELAIWKAEANEDLPPGPAPAICYGSTLLVTAAVADELLFAQIGDGDILLVSDTGETLTVFEADPQLLGGATTSLCSNDAQQQFQVGFWNRPDTLPALIMLSTDGYSNSFPDAPSFHKVASDIWEMIADGDWEKVKPTLPVWLTDTSRRGSGDDITIGLIAPARP